MENKKNEDTLTILLAKMTHNNNKNKLVPPDGGWGWIVLLGGISSLVFVSFLRVSFGILFSPLLMRESVSSETVAWIFSFFGIIINCSIIFIGPLCEELGLRNVALAGGISSALSTFLSMFAPTPNFLFFSFSVLGGFGAGTGNTVCKMAVSQYFEKRRGFALGIMTLGMPLGGFIYPLLTTFLLDTYGYKGALLIFSAIQLNQVVTGLLFQPVKWHMKVIKTKDNDILCPDRTNETPSTVESEIETKSLRDYERNENTDSAGKDLITNERTVDGGRVRKVEDMNIKKSKKGFFRRIGSSVILNLSLLRFHRVKIICFGSGCFILGYVFFQMWIPFAVISYGYSLQDAAWCISASSIANVVSRIVISLIADSSVFNVRYLFMFGILFMGIFIIAFSLVSDIWMLTIFSSCWGLGVGTSISLQSTIMIKEMGVSLFPAVMGVSSLTTAIFILVINPLIGFIRDTTSSYTFALLTIGCLDISAFVAWLLMPLAHKLDEENEQRKSVNTDQ